MRCIDSFQSDDVVVGFFDVSNCAPEVHSFAIVFQDPWRLVFSPLVLILLVNHLKRDTLYGKSVMTLLSRKG